MDSWTEKIGKAESRVPSQIEKDEERAAAMSSEIRQMELRYNHLLKEIRTKTKVTLARILSPGIINLGYVTDVHYVFIAYMLHKAIYTYFQ